MKRMRTISAIFGAIVGAIAISLVNFLLHVLFAPQLLHDGQYVFVFFLFVPQGAWLGGFTGYALARVHDADHRWAGFALLVGSLIIVVTALLLAFSYSADHWDYLTSYFGVSLLWAVVLIVWAIIWAKSKPSAV